MSVWLYLATFLIVGLSVSVLGPALTELRERSGTDIGGIGVLFVGQSLGYIVGSVVGGRLFDRYVGHRVFAGAIVVIGAGLTVVPMLDAVATLFGAFVVIGVGASIADLGANTLLMWELGAAGDRAMNLLHLSFGVGALSAPLLVHIGIGVATGGPAVLCVGLAVWALTIPSPRAAEAPREEHTDATVPILAVLGLFFAVYVGLEVGYAGWIHTYGEEIDFGSLAATWLTTTFWIGFIVGRLGASALSGRADPARLVGASCLATVVAAALLVVGDGATAAVWAGTALIGLATAPQFPGMLNVAERRIHVTGSATTWFVGGAGVGGLVLPWVIGRWFEASGATALPWAMLVFAVVTLAVFVAAVRALRR